MALLFLAAALCCFAYAVVRVAWDDHRETQWSHRHDAWLEAHGRRLRARLYELNRGLPARRP